MKNNQDDHFLAVMKAELEFQGFLLEVIEYELKLMPEGKLCRKEVNGKEYFYHCTKDKNGRYIQQLIRPEQENLKQSLIKKRCLKKGRAKLRNNIPLMREFIEEYNPVYTDDDGEISRIIAELMFDQEHAMNQ